MSDEMKCCPFGCNGDLFVVPDETGSGGQHVAPYHAGCSICKAERLGETMEAAIAAWNRRPTPEQSREARDVERLDWLESRINEYGAIHLHDGSKPYGVGLGLRPGSVVRTLREAIDAAMDRSARGREGS